MFCFYELPQYKFYIKEANLPAQTDYTVTLAFYEKIKSQLLGRKFVLKHQDSQMFCLKLNKYE